MAGLPATMGLYAALAGIVANAVLSLIATGDLRTLLKNYGLMEQFGSDHLYATNREAAAAFHRDQE